MYFSLNVMKVVCIFLMEKKQFFHLLNFKAKEQLYTHTDTHIYIFLHGKASLKQFSI